MTSLDQGDDDDDDEIEPDLRHRRYRCRRSATDPLSTRRMKSSVSDSCRRRRKTTTEDERNVETISVLLNDETGDAEEEIDSTTDGDAFASRFDDDDVCDRRRLDALTSRSVMRDPAALAVAIFGLPQPPDWRRCSSPAATDDGSFLRGSAAFADDGRIIFSTSGTRRDVRLSDDRRSCSPTTTTKAYKKIESSSILFDEAVLGRVFASGLDSVDLCRCAAVCRRWYAVVWNVGSSCRGRATPSPWTSIVIRGPFDADLGIRTLTRLIRGSGGGSRSNGRSVCVVVERLTVDGGPDAAAGARLTDRGLETASQRCPELRRLELIGCRLVTDVGIGHVIARCASLQHLDVTGSQRLTITSSLSPSSSSRVINRSRVFDDVILATTYSINGRPTYSTSTERLSIRHLDLSDCRLVDDTTLGLVAASCPSLVRLYLRRCPLVTDVGLRLFGRIRQTVAGLVGLRAVAVAGCPLVGDDGVAALVDTGRSLRYLSVARCPRIGDRAIRTVAERCRRLRYLNVRGCAGVTDVGLEAVAARCRRIESVDVGDCPLVGDRAVEALARSAAGGGTLRRLSVRGCRAVCGRVVRALAGRCGNRLVELDVRDCPLVGVEAVDDVRERCRRCVVEHSHAAFY